MKKQGVKVIDCSKGYKPSFKSNFELQHEEMINTSINELNAQGKRVISISQSQNGNYMSLYITLLWEEIEE